MSQMDWKVMAPPGTAFYVNIDGTLQLRFDSSQVDKVVQWARDWVLLFENYANARRAGGNHTELGPMPKTPAEIQAYVDKLNQALKLEREGVQPSVAKAVTMVIPLRDKQAEAKETLATFAEVHKEIAAEIITANEPPKQTKLVQCPKCVGMRVVGPADEVCDRCQGAGAVSGQG